MPRFHIRFLPPGVATFLMLLAAVSCGATCPSDPEPMPNEMGFSSNPGPWGRLHCYYFYLEAPESVVERVPLPDTQPRWRVRESELAEFEKTVRASSLPAEAADALFEPRQYLRSKEIVNLFPSHRLIETMSEADRQQIYAHLAANHLNPLYEFPIFFLSGSVDEWARDSGLRPELVGAIRSLSYHRGHALAFSDIPNLMNQARSDSEVHFIKKKLTRTRTIIARLELDGETDVPSLLNYWSTGLNLRRKELEPLMRTTAALPGTQLLDILHLLPGLPRKLLYTFPGGEFLTHARLPDCHWTTLNFFKYSAQDYYLDTRLAASSIIENFVPVTAPYRFGDVLMFMDGTGSAFHSCVYVADDLVYSKNGSNPLVPWVLLELRDLRQMYNMDITKDTFIKGYRHREGRLSD